MASRSAVFLVRRLLSSRRAACQPPVLQEVASPSPRAATGQLTTAPARRELTGRAAQSRKLRLALICSQAQTTSVSRASSSRRPPFMSGCRSLTSALYCWRISALVWRVLGVEDLQRPPLGRRQAALPARGRGALAAGVQRRLVARAAPWGRRSRSAARRAPRRAAGSPPAAPPGRRAGSGGPRPGRRRTAAPGRRRNGCRRSSTSDCTRARGRGRTTGIRPGCPATSGRGTCRPWCSPAGRRPAPRSRPRRKSRAPRARRFLSAVTEMSKSKGERRLIGERVLGFAGRLGRLSLDFCRAGQGPSQARRQK